MSITSTAVDAYLRMVRAPVGVVVGRVGGDAGGLMLDRADATLRGVVGSLLGDSTLQADAERRRAAADERERAFNLRAEAERAEARGEDRAERERQAAREKRAKARERTESRSRRSRLGAAERKAEALDRAEDAATARDEAARLGEAAARAKARRKNSTRA